MLSEERLIEDGLKKRTSSKQEFMLYKFLIERSDVFYFQMLAWMDRWVDLNKDDIRRIEEETK